MAARHSNHAINGRGTNSDAPPQQQKEPDRADEQRYQRNCPQTKLGAVIGACTEGQRGCDEASGKNQEPCLQAKDDSPTGGEADEMRNQDGVSHSVGKEHRQLDGGHLKKCPGQFPKRDRIHRIHVHPDTAN